MKIAAFALCLLAVQDNLLVIVADDVGTDRVGAYAENPDPGRTPNIDQLAARGILYRNAWVNPSCSPTRACLLTGLYSFRTGIGAVIPQASSTAFGLDADIESLPDVLGGGGYVSALLGKWHLAAPRQGLSHPREMGFDVHAGSPGNLSVYERWSKNTNGTLRGTDIYPTTDTTDDAIRAVELLPQPWLVWVAYNAAHKPYHDPPGHLHGFTLPSDPAGDPVLAVKAAIEAMDTEIGRLLEHVDLETTTVIFLSDNGLLGEAKTVPQNVKRGKGTMYEGGIHVPFIVAGRHVEEPGRESEALISGVDLLATLAEIAGVLHTSPDSISFLSTMQDSEAPSPRKWLYAEKFGPNGEGPYDTGQSAIRSARYKYIETESDERLYDLWDDPLEEHNLLNGIPPPRAQVELERLRQAMGRIRR